MGHGLFTLGTGPGFVYIWQWARVCLHFAHGQGLFTLNGLAGGQKILGTVPTVPGRHAILLWYRRESHGQKVEAINQPHRTHLQAHNFQSSCNNLLRQIMLLQILHDEMAVKALRVMGKGGDMFQVK